MPRSVAAKICACAMSCSYPSSDLLHLPTQMALSPDWPRGNSSSRKSSVLSLSSLVNDVTASTFALDDDLLLLANSPPKRPQDVVSDACTDITRELEAVEARLGHYRDARRNENEQEHAHDTKSLSSRESDAGDARTMRKSSSYPSPPRQVQQEAGQMADEVENALFNCDQLLSRARASAVSSPFVNRSAASSRVSTSDSNRSAIREVLSADMQSAATLPPPVATSAFVPVKTVPSPPYSSSSSSSTSPGRTEPRRRRGCAFDARSAEERDLETRATAIKTFAARCQKEMQAEATVAQQQQQSLQTEFLKELQRKYESKKKMAVLALKEGYERETKALVRDTMEKYEQEQAQVLAKLEEQLLKERERAMSDIVAKQEQVLEDRVKRLEARISAEALSKKRVLESQLQTELDEKLRAIEGDSDDAMRTWEVQKRLDLEHELFQRREQATMAILREQEAKTSELTREIEQKHAVNEESELEKLAKALAFGAQVQLQQLRKKFESEHDDRIRDTKANAAESLELKLQELKQVLQRSHQDELSKLKRELEKRNRIAGIELQDSLQAEHHSQLQELRLHADRERESVLADCKSDAAREHQRQLVELEQTLEMELRVKSHQTQIELEESYAQSLDEFRAQFIENHERELQNRIARMEQARSVLLAEARSFLSIRSRGPEASQYDSASEALRHLSDLKRHLSTEVAKHVDALLTDFDDMTEEQRILVAKISELTQLYLGFKRQCEKLETQSAELKNTVYALHQQLQTKDMLCTKLYQANEALLTRLQAPQASPKKAAAARR